MALCFDRSAARSGALCFWAMILMASAGYRSLSQQEILQSRLRPLQFPGPVGADASDWEAHRDQSAMRFEMLQPGVADSGPREKELEELVHAREVAQPGLGDASAGEVEVP